MAIVGHWLVGFLFSYCFPQTGVALFLKLSMASDGAVLLFSLRTLALALTLTPEPKPYPKPKPNPNPKP